MGDGYSASQIKLRNAASLLLKGQRNIFQNIGFDASATSSISPIRFGNTAANPFFDNAFTACRFIGNSGSSAQTVSTFNFTFINTFTACLFQFGGTVMRFEADANRNSFIGCSIRATQNANNVVLIEHTNGFGNAFVSCDVETCTRLMNVSGGLVTFKDTYFEAAQRSADAGFNVSASFTGGYVSFDQCFIDEMIWSVWSGVKLKMTGNYIKKSIAANFLVFREATIPWIHFDGNVLTPAPGLFMQVAGSSGMRFAANGVTYANATISDYCYVMQERCLDINSGTARTFMLSNTPTMGFVGTSELRVGNTSAGTIVGQKLQAFQSTFSASPLILGTYYLWVDGSGNLRIKNGAPTSATDGVVVGTQT
jgi:hypothetical protein